MKIGQNFLDVLNITQLELFFSLKASISAQAKMCFTSTKNAFLYDDLINLIPNSRQERVLCPEKRASVSN